MIETWTFKVVCTAGLMACLGSCDQTNSYMVGDTRADCIKNATFIVKIKQLDGWQIVCERNQLRYTVAP
jgi:hypothetical protein